jgi:hypothetical protein
MTWWCAATGAPWTWGWQAFPGVWLFVALIVTLYVLALRRFEPPRLAGGDRPTTRRDMLLFGLGVLTLWSDWTGPSACSPRAIC